MPAASTSAVACAGRVAPVRSESCNMPLPAVRAMGFLLRSRELTQVSMNLTNYEATPIFRVFDLVSREAERYGVSIASSDSFTSSSSRSPIT